MRGGPVRRGALTLLGAGDCEITATAAGSDDYNEATVGYTVTVQAAGALALTLGAIAGDGTVNIAEKAAGFEIGGDTGTEAGVGVTVEIGGETLTTTSADDAGTATWTVSVPADAAYISGTSVAVEVNASKTGYTAPAAITRSLAVDLTAPTAPGYSAPASLKVGEAITSMSPSGGIDVAEYGAAGLPSGLTLNTGTGVIGGTPEAADAATATATVTVSDAAGNTATATIIFPAVDKGDQALTGFQYSPSSVTYGSGTVPAVTAPTGVLTTLSYLVTPDSVCTVDPTSGALTLAGAGDCEITATAAGSDDYNEATVGYTVTVQAAGALVLNLGAIATDGIINIAEKASGFTISGDTESEGGVSVTVTLGDTELTATSADADPAIWSVSVAPDASYITGAGVAVEVSASKAGYSAPSAITRTLTVDLAAPTAPGYSAPGSLKVGEAITSMSPSGGIDVAEYGAAGLPSGLTLNTGTGVIGGTPDKAEANTATATITVSRRRRQLGAGDDHLPRRGQGRPGADWVPVQPVLGDLRVRHGPRRHRADGGAHDAELLGDARRCVHGGSDQRRAHLVGRGRLRDHRDRRGQRRLQRGNRRLHGDGAGRRRAGADPRRDCR